MNETPQAHGMCRRRMRAVVAAPIVVAVAVLASCDLVEPEAHGDGTLRAEIEHHRALWESRAFRDHRFTLRRLCFCPPEVVEPVRVEVRQGRAVDFRRLDGTPVDPSLHPFYPTVDGIYSILLDAVVRGADDVDVEWDDDFAVPRSAFIDYDVAMADEEVGFEVEAVEPLP